MGRGCGVIDEGRAGTGGATASVAPSAVEMEREAGFEEIKEESVPLVAQAAALATCPLAALTGLWMQEPKNESVITHCGLVTDIVSNEGCHWHNPCCRQLYTISTAQNTFDLSNQEITDLHGNPMVVSAILTYRFDNPKKALLNVRNPQNYVTKLATAVLKEVVGGYTYDELKTSAATISNEAVELLQPRVATAGCRIVDITLNEVSYSPVIAGAMLRKQQAEQLLEARSLLVTGAVDIATRALESLDESSSQLTVEERAKLVSDLIVVSIAEKEE